ncbi:unnamed protein product [Clavelina lepadiformis]|uniref:NACHT domain-containing protein n=1 Tax=Clavelina lepadiformis TaxID=159417 RepID=A0ABP0G3Y9_CLALP
MSDADFDTAYGLSALSNSSQTLDAARTTLPANENNGNGPNEGSNLAGRTMQQDQQRMLMPMPTDHEDNSLSSSALRLPNGNTQIAQNVTNNENNLTVSNADQFAFREIVRVASQTSGALSITYAPHYEQRHDNRQFVDQRQFHRTDVENCSDLNLGSGSRVSNVYNPGGPSDTAMSSERRSSQEEIKKKNEEIAINKVLELQEKYREDDIQLQGIDVAGSDIPEVHPTYVKISFYQGEAAPRTEEYLPSTSTLTIREELQVDFEDLLQSENQPHFICLIGIPGSGKTTCARRLAKSEEFTCFYMKFMDMNYETDLTLKDLFICKAYPDLEKKVCDEAFQWIVHNQKQCAFIFDGIDQAEWTLKEKVPRQDYDTPLPVADLVSNLCNKRFLPDAHLVFTSRPHSVIFLPKSCRPDATYLLGDLPYDCTKKLFYSYAGDQAGSMWEALESHAPHLISLCSNPLMIQLVVASCLNPSSKVGDILSSSDKAFTQTRVFATVLDNLKHCDNTRHENIEELSAQIGRVAFQATRNSTVVITIHQLRNEGLSSEMVQDIIITLHAHKGITSKVFEGDTKMIFCHQTFQEYYTGYHITHSMSVREFKALVEEELFTDRWAMVRRFLCGQLVDLTSDQTLEQSETDLPVEEEETSDVEPLDHSPEGTSSGEIPQTKKGRCVGNFLRSIRRAIAHPLKRKGNSTKYECEPKTSKVQNATDNQTSADSHKSNMDKLPSNGIISAQNQEICLQVAARNELDSDEDPENTRGAKRNILVDSIIGKLEEFSSKFSGDADSKRRLLELWSDVRECNNEFVRKKAAGYFPANTNLWGIPLNTSQILSCCYVLSLVQNIQFLNLSNCHLDKTSFRQFCSAIKQVPSIGMLSIVGNYLECESVSDICEILPNIKHELGMGWCFSGVYGRRTASDEERALIQRTLDGLDNSNLQVLVEIGVVLRPRKPITPSNEE